MMQGSHEVFDELLVLDVQKGSQEAFRLLVTRWNQRLQHQVYRHIKDYEAVPDVTQEVWIAIVKGMNKLQDTSKFGVWALSIASRKAVDWIRKQQTERKREEARRLASDEMAYDDGQEQEEVLNSLQEGLRQLPDDQRIILSLYYLENMSVVQIGEVLRVPQGTVKSRLFYAREQLKKIINKINV